VFPDTCFRILQQAHSHRAIVLTNNTREFPEIGSYYTRCAQHGCIGIKTGSAGFPRVESYTRCLAAPGSVEACTGDDAERWTIISGAALRSSRGLCLADVQGRPAMQRCRPVRSERWQYTLKGNLISAAWPSVSQRRMAEQRIPGPSDTSLRAQRAEPGLVTAELGGGGIKRDVVREAPRGQVSRESTNSRSGTVSVYEPVEKWNGSGGSNGKSAF
jgi:hypothetical protein